jgi:ADP-heptose:LPS heptosyltransferase
MRILAISILRLGDIFLHQEIVRDLKKAYPHAKIDLVINEQFAMVGPLLHEIDHFHFFPREALQRELVESSGSFFRGFAKVRHWIHQINLEDYDLVVDLTHTFLSQKLLELVNAKEKRGSVAGYLNDIFSSASSTSFHYVEALRRALNIQGTQTPRRIENRKIKKISIQPLTSDPKKNWSLTSFRQLVEYLTFEHPEYQIQILGAPFEEQLLRENFEESDQVKIEILSLRDLEFRLWDTGLLISGDTATIHLAAQCRTPVVGLYLGSADPFKTAPWIEGGLIIHSDEACSPCPHSGSCSQSSHLCAENLLPSQVGEALSLLLRSGISGLQFEAAHFPFVIYSQSSNGMGGLVLEDLASLEESVRAWVRQVAWIQAFEGGTKVATETLFTRFLSLSAELMVHVNEELDATQMLQEILRELERWTQELSKNLLKNSDYSDDGNENSLDFLKFRNSVMEWKRISRDEETTSLLESLVSQYTEGNSFVFYRKSRWTLALVAQFLGHKNLIYQTLKNQLKERGYNYVSGPGKLS